MNYIVLHCKGIIQHYSSIHDNVLAVSNGYYKTEKSPTRSAIVGMIGAAMGIQRGEQKLECLKNDLDYKYRVVSKGSVLVDYQTVKPGKGEKFLTSEGKARDGSIVKKIEYLQDYEFEVYVGGPDETIEEIRSAFLDPVYLPYFGKKCCSPIRAIVDKRENYKSETQMEELNDVHDCA